MNHITELRLNELESLKGQIKYSNKALNSNLENWERKEYTQVKNDACNELDSLVSLINSNQDIFDSGILTIHSSDIN